MSFCKLLTPPATQPHGNQGYVHFKRIDDMSGSNLADYSSCSRMDERWMKNTHTRDMSHIRCKLISTRVEFNFNASAISLTPSSWIWFSIAIQYVRGMNLGKRVEHNTKQHNSLSTASLVNVVFTFNISARCFTPTSPIELSNDTTKSETITKQSKK